MYNVHIHYAVNITHSLHGYGRPQFLVLSGAPSSRPDMVHFVNQISKEVGVMVCGHVLLVSKYKSNCKIPSSLFSIDSLLWVYSL